MLNKELTFHGLENIPFMRMRCTQRIFKKIITQIDPLYDKKSSSLEYCSRYLNINSLMGNFHNGLFDAKIAAKILIKLFY